MKALIILADGFEEIEAVTPVDLLRRAGVSVTTAGLNKTTIIGAHNIPVVADAEFKDVKDKEFDILILPGGGAYKTLAANKDVLDLVKRYNSEKRYIAAICAAPVVLAEAKIVDNHKVTSFPGTEGAFKKENYLLDKVVKSDNIITSRGPGTSIDFALKLIEVLVSKEKADEIAKGIVYNS